MFEQVRGRETWSGMTIVRRQQGISTCVCRDARVCAGKRIHERWTRRKLGSSTTPLSGEHVSWWGHQRELTYWVDSYDTHTCASLPTFPSDSVSLSLSRLCPLPLPFPFRFVPSPSPVFFQFSLLCPLWSGRVLYPLALFSFPGFVDPSLCRSSHLSPSVSSMFAPAKKGKQRLKRFQTADLSV